MKLNGWQRMWVVLAIVWAAVLWLPVMWFAPEPPHRLRERRTEIEAKAQAYQKAHPEEFGALTAKAKADKAAHVDQDQKEGPDLTNLKLVVLAEDADECSELRRKIKNYPQDLLVYICNSAGFWAGPLIAIYLLGQGVAWVRVGFRQSHRGDER